MLFKYSTLIFLFVSTACMAEEPAMAGEASTKLKEPVFIFELVNRGWLAELLDKGAIKAGISGSTKFARSTIEKAATAKGSVMLQCKDSRAALAIEKSLPSFEDNTLSEVDFALVDIEKCKERLVSKIAKTGAKAIAL